MLFFDFAASAGPREWFMPIELPQNVEEAIGEIGQREPGRLTFRCGDERPYAGPVLRRRLREPHKSCEVQARLRTHRS
jgi:hypothetical protein